MTSMISFPLGTALNAVQLSLDTLTQMASSAVQSIREESPRPLAEMLDRYQVPLIHRADAVRQLATAYGLSYPDGVDSAQVEDMIRALDALEQRQWLLRILALSVYQGIVEAGFGAEKISMFVSELKRLAGPGEDGPGAPVVDLDPSARRERTTMRILAKSVYGQLSSNEGYSPSEIMTLAGEIDNRVSLEAAKQASRTRSSGAAARTPSLRVVPQGEYSPVEEYLLVFNVPSQGDYGPLKLVYERTGVIREISPDRQTILVEVEAFFEEGYETVLLRQGSPVDSHPFQEGDQVRLVMLSRQE